jgi:hypothetical protein
MLVCSLVLALAGAPEVADTDRPPVQVPRQREPVERPDPPPPAASQPTTSSELPSWRSIPEPPAEPKRIKVPRTGSGLITVGSIGLGIGGALGIAAIAQAAVPDHQAEGQLGLSAAMLVGSGTAMLAIGLVVRRQYRKAPIPDAPRTGSGMQLGGLVLMAGGTVAAIAGGFDLSTQICDGTGCYPYIPGTAAAGVGCGLAGVVTGSALLIAGSLRKRNYRHWAESRQATRIRPTFVAGRSGVQFGIAGRF